MLGKRGGREGEGGRERGGKEGGREMEEERGEREKRGRETHTTVNVFPAFS